MSQIANLEQTLGFYGACYGLDEDNAAKLFTQVMIDLNWADDYFENENIVNRHEEAKEVLKGLGFRKLREFMYDE